MDVPDSGVRRWLVCVERARHGERRPVWPRVRHRGPRQCGELWGDYGVRDVPAQRPRDQRA